MPLIDKYFKHFKGRKKNFKDTRTDNLDENQVVAVLREKKYVKV